MGVFSQPVAELSSKIAVPRKRHSVKAFSFPSAYVLLLQRTGPKLERAGAAAYRSQKCRFREEWRITPWLKMIETFSNYLRMN